MVKKEKVINHGSENSITSHVAKELTLLGISNRPFTHIPTHNGNREVDILCEYEDYLYPCEAKFRGREKDLLDAIMKIENDYLAYSDAQRIKVGFILLYPPELEYEMSIPQFDAKVYKTKFKVIVIRKDVMDNTGVTKKQMAEYDGDIKEIARIIADNVTRNTELVQNIDFVQRILRSCANIITEGLRELSKDNLPHMLGGRNIFDNVIEYGGDLKNYKPEEIYEELRIASAYLLINQLLFYRLLSSTLPSLEPIDVKNLSTREELQLYFDKVLTINYKVIYGFDIASYIPRRFFKYIKGIASVIELLAPERIDCDLLGTIFHRLIPLKQRKRVAAYYTNPLPAKLLASLSINKLDDIVGDLACGSGGLAVAAYNRKASFLKQVSMKDHIYILSEIYAADVMPFAASTAASNLAIRHPEYPTEHVNVVIADSSELEPNACVSLITEKHIETAGGQTKVHQFFMSSNDNNVTTHEKSQQGRVIFPWFDVALMNPPFTKQELLSELYKIKLSHNFKDYEEYISRRMSLYGYFVLLSDKFLKDRGRLGFIIPANFLRIQSLDGVRRLLKEKYRIKHIIASISNKSSFSENTELREIMLVAEKGKVEKSDTVYISLIKVMPKTNEDMNVLIDLIKSGKEVDNGIVKIISYPTTKLYESDNWYRFVSIVDMDLMKFTNEFLSSDKLVPIINFTKPHTNTLSYYSSNGFHGFMQKGLMRGLKDQWQVVDEQDTYITVRNIISKDTINIDKSKLIRAFRRPAQLKKMNVSDDADYLIAEYFEDIKRLAKPVVGGSNAEKISESDVNEWKLKAIDNASRISYAYKVDITATGTSHVAFYAKYPMTGLNIRSLKTKISVYESAPVLTSNDEKIIVLWLNSTFGILNLLRERIETRGGFFSIDNYVFDDMLVPDIKQLTEYEKDELTTLFDKICDVEMPSILEQLTTRNPIRREIDELFMRILGINTNLSNLYNKVLNEIEILKNLMEK
jgi:hypothetical protein